MSPLLLSTQHKTVLQKIREGTDGCGTFWHCLRKNVGIIWWIADETKVAYYIFSYFPESGIKFCKNDMLVFLFLLKTKELEKEIKKKHQALT